LSLTGSKFGLGQFMNMEEKDQGDKGRSRSKSPFMWWLANNLDRSQSRQSYMSSQPQMDEVHNQYYQKPEPAFANHHAHKGSVASDYSLPSIINARELADDARMNSAQAGASPNSPHSPRYVNFSRAFSPLHQSTLVSTSAPNKVLSQIVETSPRDSAASKQPSMVSMREVVVIENENISAPPMPPHLPLPALRSLQPSPSPPPEPFVTRYSGQNMTSRSSFTTKTSLSLSTVDQSRTPSVPAVSHLPASPRSGPLPCWSPQPWEGMPSLNAAVRSVSSPETQHPSPEILSQYDDDNKENNNPRNSSTKDASSNAHSVAYWRSRPDLQPVLKLSKKGNVLKKKSIQRAEIVSSVGN
jgi:hypothetical protein